MLADVDVLGASATNVGLVWQYSKSEDIIGAIAVKVDPGCAFSFQQTVFTGVCVKEKVSEFAILHLFYCLLFMSQILLDVIYFVPHLSL